MNYMVLLSSFISVLALALAVYVLYLNPKKTLHRLCFLVIIIVSSWNFIAIRAFSIDNKETFIFWYKTASFLLLYIPISLHIVMLIVKLDKKIMIPVLVLYYLEYLFLIFPNVNLILIYKDFIRIDGYWHFIRVDVGFYYCLFISTFILSEVIAMVLLINWYKKTKFLRERKQILVLYIAIGLSLIFLFTYYVIFRFFSDKDLGLSVHFLFIWPIGIGISIIKYGFLSFSPGLFSYDVFENIEESVIVMNYNRKIILANSNAKKLISENIEESNARKYIKGYDEIMENIGKLFSGLMNNFTENVVWAKDDKTKLVIHSKFSIIKDKYNDRIGILIIGQELRGIKEFTINYKITKRELDVIRTITSGCSNREAAKRLKISELTIKTHLLHVFEKLNIKNRVELINLLKRYNIM